MPPGPSNGILCRQCIGFQIVCEALCQFLFIIQERGDNKDEFPDNFFHGSGAGTWLAFITMTTAGCVGTIKTFLSTRSTRPLA